jgi:methionine aminopeptidase
VDVGAIVEGFYGDAAKTFPVGKVAPEAERLIKITEEALYKGLQRRCREIGFTISPRPYKVMPNRTATRWYENL